MVRKGRTGLVRYPSLSVDSIQFAFGGGRLISVSRNTYLTFDTISALAFGLPFGMRKVATDVSPLVKPQAIRRSPLEVGVRKLKTSLC